MYFSHPVLLTTSFGKKCHLQVMTPIINILKIWKKKSKNAVTKSVLLSTIDPLFPVQRCHTNTAFVASHFQHCDYDTTA
jgi:hypothetical protein